MPFVGSAHAAHPALAVTNADDADDALDPGVDGADPDDGGTAVARAVEAEATGIDPGPQERKVSAAWTSATRP